MDKLLERLDINNLIKNANDGVYCGVECKKKQTETTLRENVNKAALNVKNAPEEYEKAQLDYIKFMHGEEKYNDYKNKSENDAFMKSVLAPLSDIKHNMVELNNVVENNKHLNNTVEILNTAIDDEKKKIDVVDKKLSNSKETVTITRQKTNYENDNTSFLKRLYGYSNLIVYFLFVLSLLVYYLKVGIPTFNIIVGVILLIIINYIIDYVTVY